MRIRDPKLRKIGHALSFTVFNAFKGTFIYIYIYFCNFTIIALSFEYFNTAIFKCDISAL